MGMSMGKGKGEMSEPNIVPLIDILLVLIIIFMVVTPLIPQGLDALVPQPPPPDQQQVDVDLRTVAIQLECANVRCTRVLLKLNQQDVTWETLGPRLQDIFKTRAEKVAFVTAADDLECLHVARAIDIAKGAGVDKIGLITAKIEMGE